jgi:hypothetical protein
LLLLTGQFEVQVTGIPAKTRDTKNRSPHKRKTPRYFIFSGNETGCGDAERQLRATGLFPMCVAVPRNKPQQFRPAGTRVAPPGTKRHSQKTESSVQDVLFVRPAFHFESANNLLTQKDSARATKFKKVFLDYFKP